MGKKESVSPQEIKSATRELEKEVGITDISRDVEEALSKSKKPIQRLGQGLLNGVFYYGTSLALDGENVSAVVTSEKKIYLGINYITWKCSHCHVVKKTKTIKLFKMVPPKICACKTKTQTNYKVINVNNPIKDEFGLNYRTEFNDETIEYSWSTESIKKFLSGNYEKKSLKKIYEDVLRINKKYIEHLNPTSHKYIVCWGIATYLFGLFEQFGRLYNCAGRGSGKTKQARILKNWGFNTIWVTKGTESSIFRDAEATCGTFIVDNMDKLHEDMKRNMEHHIETGWMHDATYRLTNMDEGRTNKFNSYTPMLINNIFGLDENTIDKTFEIPLLKSVNKKIVRLKPTVKSEDWESIRNDLRFWVLDNFESVLKVYQEVVATFSGREFDVVEGTLTVALLIDKEIYNELEEYIREKIDEEFVDLENNNSYIVFSRIWAVFKRQEQREEFKVFLGDLSKEVFGIFNKGLIEGTREWGQKKRGISKFVGKIIRSVPMFRKGGISQGRTYISIKRKDLERYMRLQHFIDDDGTLLSPIISPKFLENEKSDFENSPLKVGVGEEGEEEEVAKVVKMNGEKRGEKQHGL